MTKQLCCALDRVQLLRRKWVMLCLDRVQLLRRETPRASMPPRLVLMFQTPLKKLSPSLNHSELVEKYPAADAPTYPNNKNEAGMSEVNATDAIPIEKKS